MLIHLHIENYALIKASDIDFDSGFITITGETGAGKSIILGALSTLLGQRADTQVLFDKQVKSVIEAQFKIGHLGLQQLFAENDLDYDDTLLLRREILPTGKTRAFVNDTPAPLQLMKELGSRLVDIHSQHETLTLANSRFQMGLLDILADDAAELKAYQTVFKQYTDLKRQLEQMTAEEAQCRRERDYLQFQFDELHQAQLVDGEQEELEQELQLLSNTENIKQIISVVIDSCDESDDSAISRLNGARTQLSRISHYHQDIQSFHLRLDSALIELKDIFAEMTALNDNLSFSPQRLQDVSDRLDTIYRLQKKHAVSTVSQLIEITNDIESRLLGIDSLENRIAQTMEAVDIAFCKLQDTAQALSTKRLQAAELFPKQVLPTLSLLGMTHAQLQFQVTEAGEYGTMGSDRVELFFNANKGGQMRPLGKAASGGEMSRLMLAIKSMISQSSLLPTIIFDEIDTGVSGDISMAVASIMQRMSQHMQVLAITHLPQIAARADSHFKVFKHLADDAEGARTVSLIKSLDVQERVTEIAVMLSSDPPTPSAIQTARELMELPSPC